MHNHKCYCKEHSFLGLHSRAPTVHSCVPSVHCVHCGHCASVVTVERVRSPCLSRSLMRNHNCYCKLRRSPMHKHNCYCNEHSLFGLHIRAPLVHIAVCKVCALWTLCCSLYSGELHCTGAVRVYMRSILSSALKMIL